MEILAIWYTHRSYMDTCPDYAYRVPAPTEDIEHDASTQAEDPLSGEIEHERERDSA